MAALPVLDQFDDVHENALFNRHSADFVILSVLGSVFTGDINYRSLNHQSTIFHS